MPRTELCELRTSHAKVFDADGRRQVELTVWPRHYLDSNGLWQDCDSAIYGDTDEAEFDSSSKKGWASAIRFSKKAAQPVRIERGGCRLTYRAQNVGSVKGQVTGNRISFPDAWPSADLVWYSVPEGLHKEIVLRSASAPAAYSFLVETQELELRRDDDGVIRAWAGPFPAFELVRPWAEDAAGERGPVTVALRQEGGGLYLDISIDPAWLSDPARVYPVILDPTTIQPDAAAGKDAYVDENSPSTNYGTAIDLRAGSSGIAGSRLRGLVEFALAAYSSWYCESGFLHLYCSSEEEATNFSVGCHAVTAPWTETGVTWANQPAHNSATATVSITNVTAWFIWDITTLFAAWFAGTLTNNGAKMVNVSEATIHTRKSFYSSDYATDPSLRPKVVLIMDASRPTVSATSPTGTEGSPGTVTDDLLPTLSWSYADSLSHPQTRYQLQLFTSDGLNEKVNAEVASADGHYHCTAGLLVHGMTYKWRVRAADSNVWSAWTPWQYFTTNLSAPTGLSATAHAAAAHIDLAWSPHPAGTFVGCNLWRKSHGAADSTYSKVNLALLTGLSFIDDYTRMGREYTYALSAVVSDGYESARCAGVDGQVTFAGFWFGDLQVEPYVPIDLGRDRWSSVDVNDLGDYTVQDLGYLPREATLTLAYRDLDECDALCALFDVPGVAQSYRDEVGHAFRGKLTGRVQPRQLRTRRALGYVEFKMTEASPDGS